MLDITLPRSKAWKEANDVLVDPSTGRQWARIDRGCPFWMCWMMPGEESEALMQWDVPGSILVAREQIEILPHYLLQREFRLYTRPEGWVYNGTRFVLETAVGQDLKDLIAQTRVKVLSGNVTDEELRNALKAMRQDRLTAVPSMKATKALKAVTPEDANKALEDFLKG